MFLITGATGNIGGLVLAELMKRGVPVRALVRDAAKSSVPDFVVGDHDDASAVAKAMAGIDTLFLVNVGAAIAERDERLAKAARDAGVKRIVKLSSMDVHRADGSAIAAWHARGEDLVKATGLAWTFVRPAGFMSNALAWADAIKSDGVVKASTGTGKVAMIHPADIAEVCVAALTDSAHDRTILEITGPEALSYEAMVRIISPSSKFVPIGDEEARERLLARGLPPPVANALVSLWRGVREGKLETVTPTALRVLGKPARTFEQWARENAAVFRDENDQRLATSP